MQQRDDILMTGAGLVSSLGLDRETTWKAVSHGECGIRPLTMVESDLQPNKGGGEVKEPDDASQPREVFFLRRALNEALDEAGLTEGLPCESHRCAVLLGSTLHGMRNGGAFLRSGDYQRLKHFLAGSTLAGTIVDLPGAGMTATNCSACSSGLASIALGHTLLQSEEADLVIAGGYDPISEYSYAGFNSMRLVSGTTLRPFARSRDGMKVAEGYAIVVLERAADANKRGAKVQARIAGYGESCDAFHLSKPHPEGAGAAAAMKQALNQADLKPEDIDLLVAHATASPDNDKSEHAAMRQVFGETLRKTPLVGFKSHLGHSLGAAGTVDLILASMALRDGIVPPIANLAPEDADFDDVCVRATPLKNQTLKRALNTSLGFGGANMCMIVESPSTSGKSATKNMPPQHTDVPKVAVTGIGVMIPGALGTESFTSILERDANLKSCSDAAAITPQDLDPFLSARRTRRMSLYARLCLAATADAYHNAGIEDIPLFGEHCSAIVGTMHGAAEYCNTYYRQLIDEGIDAANPLLFGEGVPNVASAHLTTTFSIHGFCQSMIGTRTAGLEALILATSRIRAGIWDRAIVCAADEPSEQVRNAYHALIPNERLSHGGGAVTLILENDAQAKERGATVRATIERAASGTGDPSDARRTIKTLHAMLSRMGDVDELGRCQAPEFLMRAEKLALRKSAQRGSNGNFSATLSTEPDLPELFSAGPLAMLASKITTKPSNQAQKTTGIISTDEMGSHYGVAVRVPG